MNAVHPMALQLESTFEATTFVQLDLVLRQHGFQMPVLFIAYRLSEERIKLSLGGKIPAE